MLFLQLLLQNIQESLCELQTGCALLERSPQPWQHLIHESFIADAVHCGGSNFKIFKFKGEIVQKSCFNSRFSFAARNHRGGVSPCKLKKAEQGEEQKTFVTDEFFCISVCVCLTCDSCGYQRMKCTAI